METFLLVALVYATIGFCLMRQFEKGALISKLGVLMIAVGFIIGLAAVIAPD